MPAKKPKPTKPVSIRLPDETYDALARAAFHQGYPHTMTSIASGILVKYFAKAVSK